MTHDYDIISGKCIWNLYRFFFIQYGLSIWFILGDSLWLRSGGTLWSWACCLSPAGNTAIQCLQLRYSGNHFDPEVAVRVWRGTLQSRGQSLQLRSGREHSDPEFAVQVRRGTLRFSSWGPAEITLIQRLLFGSGEDHCDLDLQRIDSWHQIKPNNYHLTSGEKHYYTPARWWFLDINAGAVHHSASSVPARRWTSYVELWTLWTGPGPEERECQKRMSDDRKPHRMSDRMPE